MTNPKDEITQPGKDELTDAELDATSGGGGIYGNSFVGELMSKIVSLTHQGPYRVKETTVNPITPVKK